MLWRRDHRAPKRLREHQPPGRLYADVQCDGPFNAAEAVTRTVTVADRTPCGACAQQGRGVTITCGRGYAERGATLTDACEPGTEVRVSGDLNPNVVSVYTIFYDATDAAGTQRKRSFGR